MAYGKVMKTIMAVTQQLGTQGQIRRLFFLPYNAGKYAMQCNILASRSLTGLDLPGCKLYPHTRSYVHSPITCVHPVQLTPLSFTEVNRDAGRWQAIINI